MKTILITGAYSLLGNALLQTMSTEKYRIITTWHNKKKVLTAKNTHTTFLDIANPTFVYKTFKKFQPEIIIHAAAISDVDYCEEHKEEAIRINIGGTKNILSECQRFGTKIIFISTNAVFDGTKAPYNENDTPHPIVFYGKTKLQGEKLVKKGRFPFVIVRLTTMYGWQPQGARLNPVTWMLQMLTQGKKLFTVDDRFINPLFNLSAAESIAEIISNDQKGIFHIAGKNRVSRFKLAKKIASVFKLPSSHIVPVKSSFFPNLTPRPIDASLSTQKMEKELRIKPLSLKEGLLIMKKQYAKRNLWKSLSRL